MIEDITPVVLTLDEAPNLERTLSHLRWARDVVVVDSFSRDETVAIARAFPRVRVYQRTFDGAASQWNFALQQTDIGTEWALALDADFVVTDALLEELRGLRPRPETWLSLPPIPRACTTISTRWCSISR